MTRDELLADLDSATRAGDMELASAISAKLDAPKRDNYSPLGSNLDNFLAGAGSAVNKAGLAIKGAIDIPAQALERKFGTFRPLGMPSAAESAQATDAKLAEAEQLDKPLMGTKAGRWGDVAGNVAMLAPTAFVPGANTVAGSSTIGALSGALMTPGSIEDRAKAGGLNAILAGAGTKVGNTIGGWASNKLAAREAASVQDAATNAVRDKTLQDAQKLGMVVPPVTVNPGSNIARMLESIGGKAQTSQAANLNNAAKSDAIAREYLGMSKTAPITESALKDIRTEAGKVYGQVEQGLGDVVNLDDTFRNDLLSLAKTGDRVALEAPKYKSAGYGEIVDLADSLAVDKLSPRVAMEITKDLRAKASENFSKLKMGPNPGASALAKAQIDAANALEDQIARTLVANGNGDLVPAFEAARMQIAKSHSVSNALNEGSGHVDLSKLSSQLKKGKPLSGDILTAAKFAQAFPEASRPVRGSTGVNALDSIVGGSVGGTIGAISGEDGGHGGMLGTGAGVFLTPLLRGGARSALMSRTGQQLLARPSYAPGFLGTAGLKTAEQLGPYGGLIGMSYGR